MTGAKFALPKILAQPPKEIADSIKASRQIYPKEWKDLDGVITQLKAPSTINWWRRGSKYWFIKVTVSSCGALNLRDKRQNQQPRTEVNITKFSFNKLRAYWSKASTVFLMLFFCAIHVTLLMLRILSLHRLPFFSLLQRLRDALSVDQKKTRD